MKQMVFVTECVKNANGECCIICRLPNGQVINYAGNVTDYTLWLDEQFTKFLSDEKSVEDTTIK